MLAGDHQAITNQFSSTTSAQQLNNITITNQLPSTNASTDQLLPSIAGANQFPSTINTNQLPSNISMNANVLLSQIAQQHSVEQAQLMIRRELLNQQIRNDIATLINTERERKINEADLRANQALIAQRFLEDAAANGI